MFFKNLTQPAKLSEQDKINIEQLNIIKSNESFFVNHFILTIEEFFKNPEYSDTIDSISFQIKSQKMVCFTLYDNNKKFIKKILTNNFSYYFEEGFYFFEKQKNRSLNILSQITDSFFFSKLVTKEFHDFIASLKIKYLLNALKIDFINKKDRFNIYNSLLKISLNGFKNQKHYIYLIINHLKGKQYIKENIEINYYFDNIKKTINLLPFCFHENELFRNSKSASSYFYEVENQNFKHSFINLLKIIDEKNVNKLEFGIKNHYLHLNETRFYIKINHINYFSSPYNNYSKKGFKNTYYKTTNFKHDIFNILKMSLTDEFLENHSLLSIMDDLYKEIFINEKDVIKESIKLKINTQKIKHRKRL